MIFDFACRFFRFTFTIGARMKPGPDYDVVSLGGDFERATMDCECDGDECDAFGFQSQVCRG